MYFVGVLAYTIGEDCAIVHLTLHKSFVMVDGREFKLQLVCDPIMRAAAAVEGEVGTVLLPSGAFRLHSRMDVPTLTRQLFTEWSSTPYGPVLLVRLNNVAYTARAWEGTHVINGEALLPPAKDWMNTGLANRLFLPETTILQSLAGGAWISHVDLDTAFYGTHRRCAIVHLTLHNSHVMVDGGEFSV